MLPSNCAHWGISAQKLYLAAAICVVATTAQAHTVGIGWLDNGNGTVTMFAEHWHNDQSGPSTANGGLGIFDSGMNELFRTPWIGVINNVNETSASFSSAGAGTSALTGYAPDPGNNNGNSSSYDDWLYSAPLTIGNGTYSFFTGTTCCIDTMSTPLTFALTGITSVAPGTGPGAPTGNQPPAMAPVPLPAAGWMLLAGLGGMAALRRGRTA